MDGQPNCSVVNWARELIHCGFLAVADFLTISLRIIEELVTSTLDLLSLTYFHPAFLGPAHFLSLIDTQANWFRKWMVNMPWLAYACTLYMYTYTLSEL